MTLSLITRSHGSGEDQHAPASVLGGVCVGSGSLRSDWPVQLVPAPVFGDDRRAVEEQWLAEGVCHDGEMDGIRFRCTDGIVYGVLTLDEASFPGPAALREASGEAYRRIFRLLDEQRTPNLWRAWNYMADINGEQDGLERYRQFNIGRQEAFLACGRQAVGNVPAACALGLAAGPLRIAFMAGSAVSRPIENPRQVSAYNYPAHYGPRSPVFARAGLVSLADQELLVISGTASILDHRTVHFGDVRGQTRESLANVDAVLAEANRIASRGDYVLGELTYRVYVRHAADFPAVCAILADHLGARATITCVQADICRADLLVEIEAAAIHSTKGSR